MMNENKSKRIYELEYHLAKVRGFIEEQAIDYAKRQVRETYGCTFARNSVTGKIYTKEQVATRRFHGGR